MYYISFMVYWILKHDYIKIDVGKSHFYHFNDGLGAQYGLLLLHTLPASVNGTVVNACMDSTTYLKSLVAGSSRRHLKPTVFEGLISTLSIIIKTSKFSAVRRILMTYHHFVVRVTTSPYLFHSEFSKQRNLLLTFSIFSIPSFA